MWIWVTGIAIALNIGIIGYAMMHARDEHDDDEAAPVVTKGSDWGTSDLAAPLQAADRELDAKVP